MVSIFGPIHQFSTPSFLISLITQSIQHNLGLPTLLPPLIPYSIILLGISHSFILLTCPTHLKREILCWGHYKAGTVLDYILFSKCHCLSLVRISFAVSSFQRQPILIYPFHQEAMSLMHMSALVLLEFYIIYI